MHRIAITLVAFLFILFHSFTCSSQSWEMISSDTEVNIYASQIDCDGDSYIVLSYESKSPIMQSFSYDVAYNNNGFTHNSTESVTGLHSNYKFDVTCDYIRNFYDKGIFKLPVSHVADLNKLNITIKR